MKMLYVNVDELIDVIKEMNSNGQTLDDVIKLLDNIRLSKFSTKMDVKEINHGYWQLVAVDKKGNMTYACPFCGDQQQGMSQYCGLCGAELEPDWPGRKESNER